MFEITKVFEFSAGHHIATLPEGHPCKRPHGHNYAVTVVLRWNLLDGDGMVVDYGRLKVFKEYLDNQLDHRILNEVLAGIRVQVGELAPYDLRISSTAELLAKHLYSICKALWPQTYRVIVCETPKTTASYWEE